MASASAEMPAALPFPPCQGDEQAIVRPLSLSIRYRRDCDKLMLPLRQVTKSCLISIVLCCEQIKGGAYQSFGDLDRDLKLMWENCRKYNGPVSASQHFEARRRQPKFRIVYGSGRSTKMFASRDCLEPLVADCGGLADCIAPAERPHSYVVQY